MLLYDSAHLRISKKHSYNNGWEPEFFELYRERN